MGFRIPALPRAEFGLLKWERHNWLTSPRAGGIGRIEQRLGHLGIMVKGSETMQLGEGVVLGDVLWIARSHRGAGTHAVYPQLTHTGSWRRYRDVIGHQIGRNLKKYINKKYPSLKKLTVEASMTQTFKYQSILWGNMVTKVPLIAFFAQFH